MRESRRCSMLDISAVRLDNFSDDQPATLAHIDAGQRYFSREIQFLSAGRAQPCDSFTKWSIVDNDPQAVCSRSCRRRKHEAAGHIPAWGKRRYVFQHNRLLLRYWPAFAVLEYRCYPREQIAGKPRRFVPTIRRPRLLF